MHLKRSSLLVSLTLCALASCATQGGASGQGNGKDSYTITFDSRGGSAIAPLEVPYGELATKPADPQKDGASFEGWFVEEACLTEFDFAKVKITADWTLYAGWEEGVLPPSGSSSDTGAGEEETRTVYFKDPQWWAADGARTSLYCWDDAGKASAPWPGTVMTLVEGKDLGDGTLGVDPLGGNVWSIELNLAEASGGFIFCRHNADANATENRDWGAKTPDLSLEAMGESNFFDASASEMVWGDPGIDGVWGTYPGKGK